MVMRWWVMIRNLVCELPGLVDLLVESLGDRLREQKGFLDGQAQVCQAPARVGRVELYGQAFQLNLKTLAAHVQCLNLQV